MSQDHRYIVPDLMRKHAQNQPDKVALISGGDALTYHDLNIKMDQISAALQAAGVKPTDCIALCGLNSISYMLVFLAALRAGAVPALIAPSATSGAIASMVGDSGAKMLFCDDTLQADIAPLLAEKMPVISLTPNGLDHFTKGANPEPASVTIDPNWAFNIIYSSGTTGTPKGIIQSHEMRSGHIARAGVGFGYSENSVTMVATPLYSNTTLVSAIPAIALGGTLVLSGKFDAVTYLRQAERYGATHTMLVPVQYKRLMSLENFGDFNLSSFQVKFCTSAPFSADLKADILARWPGGLVEFYGMTEGGGTCILVAHQYPDKLHTVGMPAEGHDIRLIDDSGTEVGPGKMGEIVGASESMMEGYKDQPEKTREAEWFDKTGKRFIRTGDIGMFDTDGFLILMDRKKDMIISGGFNIYPSDLESELIKHKDIKDVAVVGVPSEAWGETPVAFVVLAANSQLSAETIKAWLADRVGKTQRLHDVVFTHELPRSAIGKILKRTLRDQYQAVKNTG